MLVKQRFFHTKEVIGSCTGNMTRYSCWDLDVESFVCQFKSIAKGPINISASTISDYIVVFFFKTYCQTRESCFFCLCRCFLDVSSSRRPVILGHLSRICVVNSWELFTCVTWVCQHLESQAVSTTFYSTCYPLVMKQYETWLPGESTNSSKSFYKNIHV